MMERTLSPTSGPSRRAAGTSSRKSGYGGRAAKRSVVGRVAFRLVLVAGGLALALPYVLAFTPPVQSYPGAVATAGMAPEMTLLLDAEAVAAGLPDAEDTLNVVQSSFDPVLVERVEGNAPAMDFGMVGGSADAPVVTPEMLRILAPSCCCHSRTRRLRQPRPVTRRMRLPLKHPGSAIGRPGT
jgi:hypothetical protein